MTVFVARQPILDRFRRTCAYELLYRGGVEAALGDEEPDRATLKVIDASFFVLGIESLTGGRPAYVNFTRQTLINGYTAGLHRDRLVVELLEDVVPDAEVIRAGRRLKAAGYRIALDDVITVDVPGALVELADIIKVDFRQTDRATRRQIARTFQARRLRLLAEKVETEEEVEQALADGYHLFQGFFFARPTVVSGREVPALKQNVLRLLREVHRADPDHRRIEDIIRHDVALAFKLLARIGAAAWGLRRPVASVGQALLLLGDQSLRKWASIVAVATLGHDRPAELVVVSLVRAAFCEQLMSDLGRPDLAEEGFLMGLFSTLEALLGLPLSEALDRLPLANGVRTALLGGDNILRSALDLALAYERGAWHEVSRLAAALGATDDLLARRYQEAVEAGGSVVLDEPAARLSGDTGSA